MRKTVPTRSKQSSTAANTVSESAGNGSTSLDASTLYHDVGTTAKATSTSRLSGRDSAGSNPGLFGDPLSTTSDRPIDKHLHNNLSTDLSTAAHSAAHSVARSGGFVDSPANREQQHLEQQRISEVGNSSGNTALQQCVVAELDKYFAMLEGHPPNDLYKLVITQVETALFGYVLEACGNNQSRAAEYLGVSRGTLRNRIVDLSLD